MATFEHRKCTYPFSDFLPPPTYGGIYYPHKVINSWLLSFAQVVAWLGVKRIILVLLANNQQEKTKTIQVAVNKIDNYLKSRYVLNPFQY